MAVNEDPGIQRLPLATTMKDTLDDLSCYADLPLWHLRPLENLSQNIGLSFLRLNRQVDSPPALQVHGQALGLAIQI